MDPITHALTGATLAWAVSHQHLGRKALVAGAIGALLPDADIVIRSASDPLLAVESHRGFTHSLLFVPMGGLLAGLPFGRRAILPAILAYLSHALLDASTTYGTQLLWPFSRHRAGWDIISIIDPVFALLFLIGVVAAVRARERIVTIVIACAVVWLAVGFAQRERAMHAQEQLARSRGEARTRGAVFPTVGLRIEWRSLYATDDQRLRMDRIRIPWFGTAASTEVTTVPQVIDTRSARDLARFAWFSDGWMATDPTDPTVTGDARYSMHADRYVPVWGIRLYPTEWIDRSRQRRFSQ